MSGPIEARVQGAPAFRGRRNGALLQVIVVSSSGYEALAASIQQIGR